jgi:hypothetical protein
VGRLASHRIDFHLQTLSISRQPQTPSHCTQTKSLHIQTKSKMLSLFRQNMPRAATRAFSTTAARPLAKMQIIGRLADTPELFDTASGKQIVRYALGVSAGPRDEQGNRSTSWFRVASFMQEGPQRDLLLGLPKG